MEVRSDDGYEGGLEGGTACIICRSSNLGGITTETATNFQKNHYSSSPVLSKHLRIYFLLRHVLELPSEQLEIYLRDFPNPENWVKICCECETKYLGKCEKIFVELLELKRRFAGAKLELIGAMKKSSGDQPGLPNNTEKVISNVDQETCVFVERNDYCHLLPGISPFIDGDSLAEAKCQSSEELHFEIKEEPPSPKSYAIDEATNFTNVVSQEDFSPDPRSPPENGNPHSGEDWTPDEMSDSNDDDFPEMKTASRNTSSQAYHLRQRTIPNPKKNLKQTSLSIKQRKCDLCGKTFKTLSGLLAHKAFSHPSKTYKCSKCDWTGKYKFLLKRHMTRWHGTAEDLKALTCYICGKIVESKHYLKHHLVSCEARSKENLKCPHCGKEFPSNHKAEYLTHVGSTHQITDHFRFRCSFTGCSKGFYMKSQLKWHEIRHKPPELECSICGAKFHVKNDLQRHIRRHSSKQLKRPTSHKCSECELSFAWKRQLDSHLAKVHSKSETINDANFKCSQCPLQFWKSDLLRRHLMTIHKVFECSECDWKGNSRVLLQFHLRTEHNKVLKRRVPKHGPPSSSDRRQDKPESLRCQTCGKEYKCRSSLRKHQRCTHELNDPGNYKCSFENCEKLFSCKSQLTRHLVVHKAPSYKCDPCGVVYSARKSLRNHLNKVHGEGSTGEGPAENPIGQVKKKRRILAANCTQCNLTFQRRNKFQTHMKEVHGVEETIGEPESFQCSICGIICAGPRYLQRHIDTVHERMLDVCCDLCGKIFNGNALKMHKMVVHNVGVGDRHRLQCTVESCTREFWTESQMRIHVRTVHEKERAFQCEECGKKLVSKEHLKHHIEAMHKNKESKPFKCEVCGNGFAINKYLKNHIRKNHGKV